MLVQAPAARQHTVTGTVRTHAQFHSKYLTADRDVLVYLPPGYAANRTRRYPVFYLQDGQNLFDGATSFLPGQEWQADENAERLINAGKIEPVILVGIYNSGAARLAEYTPVKDEEGRGGDGAAYCKMLVEELKPFIDKTYRTKPAREDTAIGGSSLGALISLYVGLEYPQVFGKLAILSPSVWWADRDILRRLDNLDSKPDLKIWLDIGEKEPKAAVPDARLLRDLLAGKGWQLGKDLAYTEAAGAEHNEKAWAGRIGGVLEYLFPGKP